MFSLLVLLSLITSSSYGVFGITIDASLLTQLGYSNQSSNVYIDGYNINSIDPNAFNGYTNLTSLSIKYTSIVNLDLEVFKELVNLNTLDMSYNRQLTQFTNSKKIKLSLLDFFSLSDCPLVNLDSNVINAMPNLTYISFYQLNPIKPNQLSPLKKLKSLITEIKNQTTLTKSHFTGLNSLNELSFTLSSIKTIEVHTLLALPNATYVRLSYNELRSFEYLQIPPNVEVFDLQRNKMNYFRLSRTMSVIQNLNLRGNQFRSFKSMDFTFLTNLIYLDLSNNPHAYPNEISSHMKHLINLNYIGLDNLSISSIDSNFFKYNTKLQNIYLSNNNISVLPFNTFSNLKSLDIIELSYNQISSLDNRTFVGLNNLISLGLHKNRLTKIARGTFYNLSSLTYLLLQDNLITEIESSAFTGCYNLRTLYIYRNRLTKLSPRTFYNLTLNLLIMNYNQITELDNLTFDEIKSVQILSLSSNNISTIGSGTFNSLNITEQLDLSQNRLTKIDNETFAGLNQLSSIYLNYNKLSTIESGAFNNLANLKNIYLEYNNITELDDSTFFGCDNLQSIYLVGNPIASTSNLQRFCPTTAVSCQVYF